MTKMLKRAIAEVQKLPDEEQNAVAKTMLAWSDSIGSDLDFETRLAILEGLAQMERGEFVPDEVVRAAEKRRGL
jgi:hypothetical protein